MPITFAAVVAGAAQVVDIGQKIYDRIQAYKGNQQEIPILRQRVTYIVNFALHVQKNKLLDIDDELEIVGHSSMEILFGYLRKAEIFMDGVNKNWEITKEILSVSQKTEIAEINLAIGRIQLDIQGLCTIKNIQISDDILKTVKIIEEKVDLIGHQLSLSSDYSLTELEKQGISFQKEKKPEQARSVYEQAIRENLATSRIKSNLAQLLLTGAGGEKDEKRAFTLYREAAKKKDFPRAMYSLAQIYYHGIGRPVDKESAIRWYRETVNSPYSHRVKNSAVEKLRGLSSLELKDDIKALYQLGMAYEDGHIIPDKLKSRERALELYKLSLEHPPAEERYLALTQPQHIPSGVLSYASGGSVPSEEKKSITIDPTAEASLLTIEPKESPSLLSTPPVPSVSASGVSAPDHPALVRSLTSSISSAPGPGVPESSHPPVLGRSLSQSLPQTLLPPPKELPSREEIGEKVDKEIKSSLDA